MKRVGALNTYRMIMIFIHLFFTHWILNVWGFTLRTFLFLTKINFFVNFFYFFYSGIIISYFTYKVNENKNKAEHLRHHHHIFNEKRLSEEEKFMCSTFKFSFCLSVVVNILYWSLNFFLPTMLGITPVPVVLELFLHGGNLAVLLIDLIFNSKFSRHDNLLSRSFLVQFTIFYFTMQYFVYYTMNIEIYPMVSKLSFPQYSLVGAAGYGLLLIGDFFYENILPFKKSKKTDKISIAHN